MAFDWLIRGGTVLDGTGSPGRRADVGLTADRVAAVAPDLQGEAGHILEAAGCGVTPGFAPETVADLASYQAPHWYPVGIRWVWVNGRAVLEAERFHPRPTGRVLAPRR